MIEQLTYVQMRTSKPDFVPPPHAIKIALLFFLGLAALMLGPIRADVTH